jgi:hypothetical protein
MGTSRDLRWWDLPTWTARQLGIAGQRKAGLALGPQTLVLRRPTRRELPGLLGGGRAGGITTALPLGVLVGGVVGGVVGVGDAVALTIGLTIGLAGGLMEVWSTPSATARAATPIEVYRSDRRRTLAVGLTVGLTVWLAVGLTVGLTIGVKFGLADGLAVGLAVGLAFALAFGLTIGSGPALRLAVIEVVWGLRGRRPRFMRLLQTALRRQVLRQAGAVYQFRHAALQDHLLAAGQVTTLRHRQRPAPAVPDSVVSGTTTGDADPADETRPGTECR